MSNHVIVIETGFKSASANYKIHTIGPVDQAEADSCFQSLMAGTAAELPSAKGTTVIKVSDAQFMRIRTGLSGSTILDRVTRGTVV